MQNMSINIEEIGKFLVSKWKEIINYTYKNEKDVPPKSCIANPRPSSGHIMKFLKMKFQDIEKKEVEKIIKELNEQEYLLILPSKHIKLGKKGIELFVKIYAEKGEWDYEEKMNELRRRLQIFKDPEYSTHREEKRNGKTSIEKEKVNEKINEKKKKETDNIDKEKNKKKEKSINKARTLYNLKAKINVDTTKSHSKHSEINNKNLNSYKKDRDIKQIIETANSNLSSLEMDQEYLYLMNIFIRIKNENKGKTLKEKDILEYAKKIDQNFADKFFERVFRMTPFPEFLKLKPSGYNM